MIAAPVAPETLDFPVPLRCPRCAQPYGDERSCACGERVELWHGLPRTLFGQSYSGEMPPDRMHRVLDRLESTHSKDALLADAPDEPVTRRLLQYIGADFVYGMPWDRIHTVLEVGAGMGFMTTTLARFAREVVAL